MEVSWDGSGRLLVVFLAGAGVLAVVEDQWCYKA